MSYIMLNKSIRCIIFVIIFGLAGCSHIGAYRTDIIGTCEYKTEGDCSQAALQQYAKGQEQEYRLDFVEFDDQGQVNDRAQMQAVLNQYQTIAGKEDIILIAFIHGWHHSAKPEDGNIQSFRGLLRSLAKTEHQTGKNRKILGIYIGWRGDSFNVEYLNDVTFWDRKNTAHKVGQQGITELLLRLEEIVNVKAGIDESIPKPINNKLVTIGHSFGGAALYTSLQQILVDRFIDSRKGKTFSSSVVNGFGDLVLLMNPAFEALRYATLYDISQEYCRGYSPYQLPKLAVLTSETDYATKLAFPGGRFFATFFETHTTLARHKCKGTGLSNIIPIEIDEGEADRNTVGHFEPFITHQLVPSATTDSYAGRFSFKDLQKSWFGLKQNQSFDFKGTRLIHVTDNTVAHNPFMNIKVDTALIKNHNDIWQDEIVSFVRDLIMIATHENLQGK